MKFRTDINGLRALAVIAVVLFHFNSSWVPGGFAGVDVFFVISGFLMTGLIFRGLENNNFSILNFYVARANRIIPALSVVCLALLVFGWFYLTPLDYRTLGKHVTSSMGFLSNIIYWRESGYFDAVSHSKWLLHTWSLSVEWQFYMIYPVVLVLLKKCMSLTNIKRLLVVGTVVGFIFSVYATQRMPGASYFLFPTRAWEMMMGGLAFLYPLQSIKDTSKKYLEWAGIALILASYAFISKENLWPGYLALIPVLGAYLVIIANRSGSVITDNVVMQKVGLWSYSIYLWHWPVVVFGYYFEMQHWEWIGIPISVVLGFCSYKFVESIKFPALSSLSFKPIATFKPLWMVVSISFVSAFVFAMNGFEFKEQKDVILASREKLNINKTTLDALSPHNEKPFLIGNSNNIRAIIVGDSHAGAITSSISSILNLKKEGVLSFARSSCPFINDVDIKFGGKKIKCSESTKFNLNYIKSKYPSVPVFWVSRLSSRIYGYSRPVPMDLNFKYIPMIVYNGDDYMGYVENKFLDTMCNISKNNGVYIVSPIPEMQKDSPTYISRALKRGVEDKNILRTPLKNHLKINEFVFRLYSNAEKKCAVNILSTEKYLCDDTYCFGDMDRRPLYVDFDHLSEYGNRLLSPMFKSALSKHMSPKAQL
ncbi:acyltransferase family protein [Photobacterium carnosum]|uniref:acyltransferase family protein n=1 Tax=Photobacterium carnosum TaxID=2023717 RepID=UPI001E514F7B|nr:acyltransferase family protein [Photobacterium carnosum]MCD9494564.1 acyltransferase family protein [Photobacterium carnosum]